MKESKTFSKIKNDENKSEPNAVAVQCSVAVGRTNDSLEHEADRLANQVMSYMPSIGIAKQHSIQRKESISGTRVSDNVSEQIHASKGSGHSMDSSTQSFMQSRFGTNFSNVKIHTGEEATQMNRELNAKAFTTGNDIYFNEGYYHPNSIEGKHLLAHELTHTIQQGGEQKTIQREENDKTYAPKLDIDFKLLPPDIQLRLFHFLLQADTSKVHLDYETKSFMTGFSYQYGDAFSLNMKYRQFSTKLGWVPGSNLVSLGLSSGAFSGKLSYEPEKQKFGLGLHYGAKLLPFQDKMAGTFMAGGASVGSMLTGLPGVMDDPIGYYKTYKPDIENISKTADLVKDITGAGKTRIRFGADFSLTYDPESKWIVGAKVGFAF